MWVLMSVDPISNAVRQLCERLVDARSLVVLARTGAASAALFSLLFVGDGLLAWFGLTGILPILLHRAGCPSCSSAAAGSFQSLGPGH
jgi:hypothetical protein